MNGENKRADKVSHPLESALSGDLVTVKVEIPFNSFAMFSGSYLAGRQLVGQSAMRHE